MRIALAPEHLFHERQRLFIAPCACQLNGCRSLGIEIVRCIVRPDNRRIQRSLVGAEVFGDTESARSNPALAIPMTSALAQHFVGLVRFRQCLAMVVLRQAK